VCIQLLEGSVSLTEGSNFQALFYLGQLTLGEESVDYFRRGIQVLSEKLQGLTQEESEEQQDVSFILNIMLNPSCTVLTFSCCLCPVCGNDGIKGNSKQSIYQHC
jgi:hypothetical protein